LAFREYLIRFNKRAAWLAQAKRASDRAAGSREEYIANKAAAYAVITDASLAWSRGAANWNSAFTRTPL
jgi:hypothetical protein